MSMKTRKVSKFIEDMLDEYFEARVALTRLSTQEMLEDSEKSKEVAKRFRIAEEEVWKWIDTDENWDDLLDQAEEAYNLDVSAVYPVNAIGVR